MEPAHRLRKIFSQDTYSKEAAVRNLRRLSWKMRNAPDWTATLCQHVLKAEARKNLAARQRVLNPETLLARADRAQLERIRLSYSDGKSSYWTKYLDPAKWFSINIKYVKRFGWVLNPPEDVLDLGCGGGFFLFVLREMGSRVLGLDLPDDPILNDLIQALGIERVEHRIAKQQKLPTIGDRRFDLITAWMICFNNYDREETIWKAADWDFLLDDLSEKLKPKGKILFSLNPQADKKFYSREIEKLFLYRSDLLDGRIIIFTKKRLDKTRLAPLKVKGQVASPSRPATEHSSIPED